MLAAAALGALGAQLEQLQAAKQDWFAGASLVDKQGISLEADGAVTVRRQAFDKALRNFPKTDSPSIAKAARTMEVTDYDQVIAGERFCSRSERQALASAAATTWWSSTSVSRVRRVTDGCCACRACLGFEYDCGCPLWRCNAMDQAPCIIGGPGGCSGCSNSYGGDGTAADSSSGEESEDFLRAHRRRDQQRCADQPSPRLREICSNPLWPLLRCAPQPKGALGHISRCWSGGWA